MQNGLVMELEDPSLIASEIKDPLVSYQDHKNETSSLSSSALSTYPSKSILALLSLMVRSFLGHGRHDSRYRGCNYRAWSKFMIFFLLPIITVNASGVSLLQRF